MEQKSGWIVEFSPLATTGERQLLWDHLHQKISDPIVVKKGHHRIVERLCQNGADIHAKTNFLHNFRAKLRSLFRPCKSKMEFRVLLELNNQGIPSLIPLAWAAKDQWFGESIFYSRTRLGSMTLEDYWQSSWTKANDKVKGTIARNWAALMAQMHQNGLFHADPHPGNILILKETLELLVIDIHQPTRMRTPTLQKRKEDLAAWAMWGQVRLSLFDLAKFLKYYLQVSSLGEFKQRWIEISQITALKQKRFWARHETNFLSGNHRRFAKIKSNGLSGHTQGAFAQSVWKIATLLQTPGPFTDSLATLKTSPSSTVYQTNWEGFGLILKVIPWKTGLLSSLKRLFGVHPAKAQWFWSNALRLRLLNAPTAFAWYIDRKARHSVIITQQLFGAKQLDQWLETHRNNPGVIRKGVRDLARSVRNLHQRGVFNRDMKAANIMIDQSGEIYWVDLGGMGHLGFQKSARMEKDIARLAGSFWKNPHLSNQDRLRFLQTYLPRILWIAKGYKGIWKRLENIAFQRINSRQASGRPLG